MSEKITIETKVGQSKIKIKKRGLKNEQKISLEERIYMENEDEEMRRNEVQMIARNKSEGTEVR